MVAAIWVHPRGGSLFLLGGCCSLDLHRFGVTGCLQGGPFAPLSRGLREPLEGLVKTK